MSRGSTRTGKPNLTGLDRIRCVTISRVRVQGYFIRGVWAWVDVGCFSLH
jgi:hypothetical protein